MVVEDAAARERGRLGEVAARVDAEVHGGVGGAVGGDALSGLAQDREDVADVVLALGVVVGDRAERVGERSRLEGVGAGVDLADRELLGGRVGGLLRLDDALDVAVAVADDAPVAAGVVELGGHHGRRGAGGLVGLEQARDHLGGDERVVAGEHDDGPVAADDGGRGAHRAAGPVGLGLGHGLDVVGERGGEVVLGREDHGDPPGARLARGDDRPREHRAPAHGVQDLGQIGPHAGPLARGHDEDGRRAHPRIVERRGGFAVPRNRACNFRQATASWGAWSRTKS